MFLFLLLLHIVVFEYISTILPSAAIISTTSSSVAIVKHDNFRLN